MEEKKEIHRNCCQKTLAACRGDRIDEDTAYLLGSYFGSGMHRGEVCGALVGALMAIGLKFGNDQDKLKLSDGVINEFENKFGSILCRDQKGKEGGAPCPVLIETAIEMVHNIMGE